MRRGICKDCKKYKSLTKHSEKGNHKPPYIYICRRCHDKRDNMDTNKHKANLRKKYKPGTPKWKKK